MANNFPDLDFVYRSITPGPLGYLLHHRGHTHTVPVALLSGLLVFLIVRTGSKLGPRGDVSSLLFLCLTGPLVHIAMDFSNNYGVHPFWPLYDDWFYGDAVFIVEPWFWVAALPPLAFAMQTRAVKWVLWSILLIALAAAWTLHIVGWLVAFALTGGSAVVAAITRRAHPRTRIVIGVMGSWLVALVFGLASSRARAIAARSAATSLDTVDDVVLTPMPGNPLCFDALAIGTRRGRYVARRATVAPLAPFAPSTTDRCRGALSEDPTAQFVPVHDVPSSALRWHTEWSAPLPELAQLARNRCDFAALLRFARAPYWMTRNDELLVGDLRYDRQPGRDFADLRLPVSGGPCPPAVPPWLPPRNAMLDH